MHMFSHPPQIGMAPAGVAQVLRTVALIGIAAIWWPQVHADTPRLTPGSKVSWGTYERPFRADSPWNSRPLEPELGTATIPTSDYYPAVDQGAYSTGVFKANPQDPPMTIKGPPDKPGVWDPDAEAFRPQVVVPRWPATTLPAQGTDGHADIVDTEAGVIHSFWQLRKVGPEWRAVQYAWTPLNGRGWGDPAHYFQGARAAGVPTSGGLIRKHEVRDGDTMYRHALAMSLTYNGMAAQPAYVYPATSTDSDAAQRNTGSIPMGTLMMLPPTFTTASIRHPDLRKVVETLKTYGAYVVDRNVGTPFVIYVENGADFNLHRQADGRSGWNDHVAADLQRIRQNLKPVITAKAWIDGDGNATATRPTLNMLSMRGPWITLEGKHRGEFDTLRQAIIFPPNAGPVRMASDHANKLSRLIWAPPQSGQSYKLNVEGSKAALLRLVIKDCDEPDRQVDSGNVAAGHSTSVKWPQRACGHRILISNGDGTGETWVRGTLIADESK